MVILISSCSKKDGVVVPDRPSDPALPGQDLPFQLVLQLDYDGNQDSLDAIITLQKTGGQMIKQREPIKIGKKAGTQNEWVSAPRQLPGGSYVISQLMIKGDDKVLAVSPVVFSRKAAGLDNLLPYTINLADAAGEAKPILLAVRELDSPADFGYPAEFFPVQGTRVRVSMKVRVGKIDYEMPVNRLDLTISKADGSLEKRQIEPLEKDIFLISAEAAEQEISLSQWNLRLSKTIRKEQLADGMELVFEARKDALKLVRTEEFREIQGNWMPSAKALYSYRADGLLESAIYYQKKPEVYELVHTLTDKAVYAGKRLLQTVRTNGQNQQVGSASFEYAANGEISQVIQTTQAGTTYSVIEQTASTDGHVYDVYMVMDNGATMRYAHTMANGNKMRYQASTSTGQSESGTYEYDQMINPYAHFMFPDMNLSNVSKNNIIDVNRSYNGAFPATELYKHEYQYNGDGYPVELIRYYKSPATGEHLYRVKTMFYYQL